MSSTSLLLPSYGISCKGGTGSSQSLKQSAASPIPSSSAHSSYGPLSPVDFQGSLVAASSQNLLRRVIGRASAPTKSYHGLLQPVAPRGASFPGTSQGLLLPVADQKCSIAECSQGLLHPLAPQARSVKAWTHKEPSLASRVDCLHMQSPQTPLHETPCGITKESNGNEGWRDWVAASRIPSLFEAGDQPVLIPSPDKDFDLTPKTGPKSRSTISIQSPETPVAPDVSKAPSPDLYYLPATTYVPPKSKRAKMEIKEIEQTEKAKKATDIPKLVSDEVSTNKPKKMKLPEDIELERSVQDSTAIFDNVWTDKTAKTGPLKDQDTPKRLYQSCPPRLMESPIEAYETSMCDIFTSAPQLQPVCEEDWTGEPIKEDLRRYEVFIPFPQLRPLPVAQAWRRRSTHFDSASKGLTILTHKPMAIHYTISPIDPSDGLSDRYMVHLRPGRRAQSSRGRHACLGKASPPLRLEKELPSLPVGETDGGVFDDTPAQDLRDCKQTALETVKQTEKSRISGAHDAMVWKVSNEGLEIIKQALGLIERPNLGSWMHRRLHRMANP